MDNDVSCWQLYVKRSIEHSYRTRLTLPLNTIIVVYFFRGLSELSGHKLCP